MDIALTLGAGFPSEAGLPSTQRLTTRFLETPAGPQHQVDPAITKTLVGFWEDVFGYAEGSDPTQSADGTESSWWVSRAELVPRVRGKIEESEMIFQAEGKAALSRLAYLESHGFELLGFNEEAKIVEHEVRRARQCYRCANRVAARVATFSYRKAFSINQFQTIWERAHFVLSTTRRWLAIGYSMPEADFEFRHLLKSAQLARTRRSPWSLDVVLKGDESAKERYRCFFGLTKEMLYQNGLQKWIAEKFKQWPHWPQGEHDRGSDRKHSPR